MSDKFQGHQIVVESALANLALPVRSTLDDIASAVNSRAVRPINVTANTNTTVLAISSSGPYSINDSSKVIFPPVSNTVLNYAGETLDISTGIFSGSSPALTLPAMFSNTFWPLLLMVSKSNLIQGIYGAPQASFNLALQNAPPTLNGTAGIALVIVSTNGFNVWNTLTDANIVKFAGGGGAGGSGDGGAPIQPADGFRLASFDVFAVQPTDVASKVISSLTKATYNTAKAIFQCSCDKAKTFTTTGTAYTISSAPGYTVQAGDIIYSGTTWRRIVTATTQTAGVLDAAFPVNLAAAAGMVSQAVWTTDIVNAGDAAQFLRPRDLFPATDVTSINIDYKDSLIAADNNPDMTATALMVVSACNAGLQTTVTQPISDTFSPIYTRATVPNQILDYPLIVNAPQQRCFLTFFPNPSNVAVTNTANLISYTASIYQETVLQNGGYLRSAFCFTDSSVTPINCTNPTVVSLKTQIVLGFAFVQNINVGTTTSQIDVILDGKIVPRFVTGITTDAWWMEVPGTINTIQFWTDLHLQNFSVEIRLRQAIIDNNPVNSLRLNTLYDVIVGSAAQVTAGVAQYSTITAAIAAVAAGGTILILKGTYVEAVVIPKEVHIFGQGRSTVISGTTTFQAASDYSSVSHIKFGGNVSINAGATGNILMSYFVASGSTITDSGTDTALFGVEE